MSATDRRKCVRARRSNPAQPTSKSVVPVASEQAPAQQPSLAPPPLPAPAAPAEQHQEEQQQAQQQQLQQAQQHQEEHGNQQQQPVPEEQGAQQGLLWPFAFDFRLPNGVRQDLADALCAAARKQRKLPLIALVDKAAASHISARVRELRIHADDAAALRAALGRGRYAALTRLSIHATGWPRQFGGARAAGLAALLRSWQLCALTRLELHLPDGADASWGALATAAASLRRLQQMQVKFGWETYRVEAERSGGFFLQHGASPKAVRMVAGLSRPICLWLPLVAWHQVQVLKVTGERDEHLSLLSRVKNLPCLAHLELGGNGRYNSATPGFRDILASAPWVTQLRTLAVRGAPVYLQPSVGARPLPLLESLSVRDTAMGDISACGFAELSMPALRRLELPSNTIGDAGARALLCGSQAWLPSLQVLDLSNNPITDEFVGQLAGARLSALRVLRLSRATYACLTDASVAHIARAPWFAALEELALSGQTQLGADPQPWAALASAPCTLGRLDLTLCSGFGSAAAARLGCARWLPRLSACYVWGIPADALGVLRGLAPKCPFQDRAPTDILA